jgi:hypothetical protein
MRPILLAILLLTAAGPALATSQTDVGARSVRSCHCDRYSDPHYTRYVPRTSAYRGGRSTRY